MTFPVFIQTFFLIVFLGSLAVTGWYFITRGEIKTMEDGSKKKIGKVFRDWYFFWTKTKPLKKRVYFDTAHIADLYEKIRHNFRKGTAATAISIQGNRFIIPYAETYMEEMKAVELNFGVKFFNEHGHNWTVYKEYDDFVFPYWLRDPLAVCATCFSSLYGSIFYWLLIALVKEPVFAWSNIPWLAAVCFWIAFCFSLSVVNTALAKRFN